MALPILLMGDMGTGKSTSLRNLPPSETVMVLPNSKDFPWEGAMEDYSVAKKNLFLTTSFRKTGDGPLGAMDIMQSVNQYAKHVKFLVIEDITHFMNNRMMNDAFIKNENWSKWNHFGADVFSITVKDFETFRDDLTIIIIGHTELKENGQVGLLTAGKLLDNTVKIASYFTYALHSRVFKEGGKLSYKFQTHNDGVHLAKTPMGCFQEDFVDNDMFAVINRIKEYRSRKKVTVPVTPDLSKLPEEFREGTPTSTTETKQ